MQLFTHTPDRGPSLLEARLSEFVIREDLRCPKSFELEFQILYVRSEIESAN